MQNINRRSFFYSFLSPLFVGNAFAQKSLDITANEAYVALRGNLNGENSLFYYTGTYWGKPSNETAKPLFKVVGIGFNSLNIVNGIVSQRLSECGFWFHPGTNSLADDWVNPMNGLKCKPIHYKSSQNVKFNNDGLVIRDKSLPSRVLSMSGRIMDPVIVGDSLWSQENLIIKIRQPEPDKGNDPLLYTGPVISLNSLATYHSNVVDLKKDFVPSTLHFQSLSPWYPWMRMGQREGVCSFELVGKKLKNVSEIPNRLLVILNKRRPGFLEEPWS